MTILSVADHVDPLVYSTNVKSRFPQVDLILGAGDLDIAYYEYIISCLNKPLFFVFGNHNLKNYSFFRPESSNSVIPGVPSPENKQFFGSFCIDGKIRRERRTGLIIAGLGGCRSYNKGSHQFTEFQMLLRVIHLFPRMLYYRLFHGRWVDILLTHASPKGIHDREDPCHKGFQVFLWFLKRFRPRYLIHGHVHLYDINSQRQSRFHETIILNAYNHIVIDWEKGMKNSSYINSVAEQDFSKARHRAWFDSLRAILNPMSRDLLSFHEIKNLVKPEREKYLGMQVIALSEIVGSEDRYQDFSQHFFPKREHLRYRWMNIDKAYLADINLPPIKLMKIGDLYFVRDGNHRVSVARSQGVHAIDAEVIELTSAISIPRDATRADIMKAVLAYERLNVLSQTKLDEIIPVEMMEFTSPGRWHELLNHIEGHKYYINLQQEGEIAFPDAAQSWHDNLYMPVIETIRKEKMLARFPKRTEADLYMWIVKHWHSLKGKYGPEFPLEKAASDYADTHGEKRNTPCPWFRKLFCFQRRDTKGSETESS